MCEFYILYEVAHLVIKVYVNCIINTLTWRYINVICHCGWCQYHNCWTNCEKYEQHTVVIHCVCVCVCEYVLWFLWGQSEKVKMCARPNRTPFIPASRVSFSFKHVQQFNSFDDLIVNRKLFWICKKWKDSKRNEWKWNKTHTQNVNFYRNKMKRETLLSFRLLLY